MKRWKCVQVENHREIADCIEDAQRNGWQVNTYQATGRDIWIKHYLLFEREE